ncbi:hypothetical protein AB0F88_31950 [Streptosporangium sp. NPDC023963]|uniref:hypothetical protein n=1 Tax=Streptosporangium sp. NPDC023963 TaxID=3155608 RepID=UPI003438E65E
MPFVESDGITTCYDELGDVDLAKLLAGDLSTVRYGLSDMVAGGFSQRGRYFARDDPLMIMPQMGETNHPVPQIG